MYDKLIQKIDRELREMEGDNVSLKNAGAREALDELAHAKKCLLTCEAMEGFGGSYDRGGSYGMYGESYDRNRMGRYTSRDSYGSSRDGMMRHLEDMRRSATSADERDRVERWMREMQG